MPPNSKKGGGSGSKHKYSVKFTPDTKKGSQDVDESKITDLLSYLFFWGEKYDTDLQRIWDKLPTVVGKILASVAAFMFGLFAKGFIYNDVNDNISIL